MNKFDYHIDKGFNQEMRSKRISPSGFKPFGLNIWDQLVYTKEFSKLLTFHNANENTKGQDVETWEQIIASHPLTVVAEIIAFDIDSINHQFNTAYEGQFSNNKHFTNKVTSLIYQLAEKINSWFVKGTSGIENQDNMLVKNLRYFISTHLKNKLALLKDYPGSTANLNFDDFHVIWTIKEELNKIENPGKSEIKRQLKKIFYAFSNVVEYLKKHSPEYAETFLTNRNNAPHMALLSTFFQLLEYASNSINNFNERHAQFLYNTILKIKPFGEVNDKLFLLFNPTREGRPVGLKKGTGFMAGKDEEIKDLIYQVDADTYLNHAKVAKIYSLCFGIQEDISPGADMGFVTKIKQQENEVFEEIPEENLPKQALFAQDNRSKKIINAQIGFAISDSVLLLLEGKRTVHINIKVDSFSYQNLIKEIETAAEILEKEVKEVFLKFLNDSFKLQISTSVGILKVEDFSGTTSFLKNENNNQLEFILKFDENFPPIEAADDGEFNLPTVLFKIDEQANIFPYSIIKKLQIEEINITSSVSELKDLLIYNGFGVVDVQSPFAPFGTNPGLSSELVIGNYEMSQKDVSSIKFEMEWSGLPQNRGGFKKYYEKYQNEQLDDDKFKASFELLNNGAWKKPFEDKTSEFNLFKLSNYLTENEDIETKLDNPCKYDGFSCGSNWAKSTHPNKEEYAYDIYSKGAFFRLRFSSPYCGFGHQLYPDVLARQLKQNMRFKKQASMPALPYTPLVKSIKLSYKASSRLTTHFFEQKVGTANKAFYHIHPFGLQSIHAGQSFNKLRLLPNYDKEGYLFIGIESNKKLENCSLYIQLQKDSYVEVATKMPKVNWSILHNNTWKNLHESNIRTEGTHGLLETGIIHFQLPKNYSNKETTIIDPGLTWIRASIKGDMKGYSSLELIHLNAAKLSWVNKGNKGEHLLQGLPKKSIQKPVNKIVGLNGFMQVNHSFGSKPKENSNKVTERLREGIFHKNRAVTANDYELLVLQNFQDINAVKCFQHMDQNGKKSPGTISLVVVSYVPIDFVYSGRGIMASNLQLHTIESFARSVSAEGVNIIVRNPEYEKIQVRCKVKFTNDYLKGEAISVFEDDINRSISNWVFTKTESPFLGEGFYVNDMFALLSNLDYIEYITGFSVVHVYKWGVEMYDLFDSGNKEKDVYPHNAGEAGKYSHENHVKPHNKWGTFIPSTNHQIEELEETLSENPENAGLQTLQIDEDFIIQ